MDSVVLLFCKCNEALFRDNGNQLRESTETCSNGSLYFLVNVTCAHHIGQSGASILYSLFSFADYGRCTIRTSVLLMLFRQAA